LRLVGIRDDNGYRYYTDIESFLLAEFTRAADGTWFYAHAGGLYDFQWILRELKENPRFREWEVSASFSGGSAFIVKIRRGHHVFRILDSLWTMRTTLAEIGTWCGCEKLAEEGIFEADLEKLIVYNRRDCEILYRSLHDYQKLFLSEGTELRMTLASTSLAWFRRKFLSRDIHTTKAVNALARHSYYSSRVEIFEYSCGHAWYHDFNSSFVHAMREPLPCEHIGGGRDIRLPTRLDRYYLADVEIEIPEMYLPPLPVRRKGRIFFPWGRWRGWYSRTDIELALQFGARIIRVYDSLVFDTFTDLKYFAEAVWEKRHAGKTAFEKKGYKLAGNSGYGKFGEHEEKFEMHLHPQDSGHAGDLMLEPGLILRKIRAKVPHVHVPIAVAITSIARRNLYLKLNQELEKGGHLYYCDTDSVLGTELLQTSDKLGDLKLEHEILAGRFLQPKLYWLRVVDTLQEADFGGGNIPWGAMLSKGQPGNIVFRDIIRAKGFRKLSLSDFHRLADGEKIRIERMRRVWEMLKDRRVGPEVYIGEKGIDPNAISKRIRIDHVHTRPWGIHELNQMFGESSGDL
jgi:hypothetical protein